MANLSLNKYWLFHFDDGSTEFTYSDFASIDEEKIREYEKNHPYPENETFSFEELMEYHENVSEQALCLCDDVSKEVAEWIQEMIEELYDNDSEEDLEDDSENLS